MNKNTRRYFMKKNIFRRTFSFWLTIILVLNSFNMSVSAETDKEYEIKVGTESDKQANEGDKEVDSEEKELVVDNDENLREVALVETSSAIISGSCGNAAYYELINNTDETGGYILRISGTGDMLDYDNESETGLYITNAPWGDYWNEITKIEISDDITSIGNSAFSGLCYACGDFPIPGGVTKIGNYAFYSCNRLGNNKSLILPDTLTYIGECAFRNCVSISGDLVIPETVTLIHETAFWGDTGLDGCVIIPKNIKNSVSFSGCDNIQKIINNSNQNIELPSDIGNHVWVDESNKTGGSIKTLGKGTAVIIESECEYAVTLDPDGGTVPETQFAVEIPNADISSGDELIVSYTIQDVDSEWGDIKECDRSLYSDANDVPHALWVAGVSDRDFNGKAVTFPDLRVYNYKTLLTADRDYVVKYSGNTKAGDATIRINGKGNYTGTIVRTFRINKLSLGDGKTNHPNLRILDITLADTKKVQKGTTIATYMINGRAVQLKSGTDFVYSYSSEYDYKTPGTHIVTIVGKGNYTGTATFIETIDSNKKLISKLKFSKINTLEAKGYACEPDVTIIDGTYKLEKGRDYELEWQNNISPGTGTVIITGKDSYAGTKTMTFKISAISINKVTVTGLVDKDYTGTPTCQSGYILKYKAGKNAVEEILTEGIDYTVSYENNINAGKKATIVFTGINRFTGTLKKTYTINPHTIEEGEVTPLSIGAVPYQKNGTTPEITVTFGEKILKNGIDYTVQYVNNKSINSGSNQKTIPRVTITGKGNYKGTITKTFTIIGSSLANTKMIVSDITYAEKAGICKPSITLYDTNNVKLVAGTDYDKDNIGYTYVRTVEVYHIDKMKNKTSVIKPAYSDVDIENDIIPVGTEIKVTVYGKGNYAGTKQSTIFRFIKADLAKANVKIETQNYTGTPIELSKDQIKVTIGGGKNAIELLETDYEIVGYSNNLNKGTATVVLAGCGNYGGRKKVNFNITSKNMNYTIVYNKNVDFATGSMKNSSISAGQVLTKNAYKWPGHYFLGWSLTSNGEVAFKDGAKFITDDISYGKTVALYAQWSGDISVSFDKNAEDAVGIMNTYDMYIGKKLPKNGFTREGYLFAGWSLSSNGPVVLLDQDNFVITTDNIMDDITLYAQWKKAYKVNFDKNSSDATGSMDFVDISPGMNLPANQYTRVDYVFAGWALSSSGEAIMADEGQFIPGDESSDNYTITLYAKWVERRYEVFYELNGGVNASNNVTSIGATYCHKYSWILYSPYREGYGFEGWYTTPTFDENSRIQDLKGITGDITLYAKWGPIQEVASGKSNNIYWSLTNDGNLVVNGTGDWEHIETKILGEDKAPWYEYHYMIRNAKISISKATTLQSMLNGCDRLESVDLSELDTSYVTNFSGMFCGCSSLNNIDVTGFDTSKAINMEGMFYNCKNLYFIDVSNFDTAKVTNMALMFASSGIEQINLENFDTQSVEWFGSMFSGCSRLSALDISSFDTSNAVGFPCMFQGCSSLTALDLSSFNTLKVLDTAYMFNGCTQLKTLNLTGFNLSNLYTQPVCMFGHCYALEDLDLGKISFGMLNENMFSTCTGLKHIVLPSYPSNHFYDEEIKYILPYTFVTKSGHEYNEICIANSRQLELFKKE